MLVGYARTSTMDQIAGLQAQVDALTAHGCERLYTEQASSIGQRGQLQSAPRFRSGR